MRIISGQFKNKKIFQQKDHCLAINSALNWQYLTKTKDSIPLDNFSACLQIVLSFFPSLSSLITSPKCNLVACTNLLFLV